MTKRRKPALSTDPTKWSREEKLKLLARIQAEEAVEKARALERRGWRPWYAEIFGQEFVDVLASHHIEAIEWHWFALMMKRAGQDITKYAYFAIWSRGHMKSTLARYIAICDAALSPEGGYCLYVSGTKNKVRGHAISIETLLGGTKLLEYYPRLGVVKRGEAGQSKGWQADFIYTDAGYIFHFVSLDEGVAGANIDSIRPTLIIPDDVDDRDNSPLISENRLRVLTRAILPTRQHNTLVFWAQNYISRHSVLYAIDTGRQRVLTNRMPTKPIPAFLNFKTEMQTHDGIIRDVIITGEPTWPWYDRARAQEEINTIGLSAFLAECQHEVDHDKSELIIPEYDDLTHPITWAEFNPLFGLDADNRQPPRHWRRYVVHDWASTGVEGGHACVVLFIAVSGMNGPLPGTAFIYQLFNFPASVLAGQVARAVLNFVLADEQSDPRTYIELGLLDRATNDPSDILATRARDKVVQLLGHHEEYAMFHMSHEAKAVRDIYRMVYGLPFQPCRPKHQDGIEQIRHYFRTDYSQPHPFRLGSNGLSRMYVVVENEEQRLRPTGDSGMKLLRDQLPEWRWRPTTLTAKGFIDERPLKMDDDVGNALQMAFMHFNLRATPLNRAEAFEAAIPPELRYSTLLANSPFKHGLLPEQELAHLVAVTQARKKVGSDIEHYDDWGAPLK